MSEKILTAEVIDDMLEELYDDKQSLENTLELYEPGELPVEEEVLENIKDEIKELNKMKDEIGNLIEPVITITEK